jgi:GDSL-like Lipase/Acylhydrolase family
MCTAILIAASEMVLRARWKPPARTLAPFTKTRTTTTEYDVAIETNYAGFRDVEHSNGSLPRMAVLGDSFVFGSGVAFDDIFTSRLETLFPNPVAVHNFGVSGSGPLNVRYLWRDHAAAIHPDIVMVALFAGNDAVDALRESREARPRFVTVARAKMLYYRTRAWWRSRKQAPVEAVQEAPATQGWNAFGVANPATMEALLAAARERGVPEDSVRARLAAIPDSLVRDALEFRSNPFNLAEGVLDPDGKLHHLLLDTPEANEGWEKLEEALRELNRDVGRAGSKLVLVCIPAGAQVDSTYWWFRNLGFRLDERVLRNTPFQERLAQFAAREKIPLLDLLPVMRAHPNERLYYDQDGHWNAAGHDVAAHAIADWLRPMLPPTR